MSYLTKKRENKIKNKKKSLSSLFKLKALWQLPMLHLKNQDTTEIIAHSVDMRKNVNKQLYTDSTKKH